ncbi:MAG: hypothetical protein H3C26_07160 [Rhodocyclaceae bacterium]|nr:hypothetical protein [Rhodocyclaceae bacterium]
MNWKMTMEQLTQEQAIAFHDSGAWKQMGIRERAVFQMAQDRLCMPFSEFHKACEEVLGRPVYTHEFGMNRDGLQAELEGKAKAPTLEEILAMLPAEKTVVLMHNGE